MFHTRKKQGTHRRSFRMIYSTANGPYVCSNFYRLVQERNGNTCNTQPKQSNLRFVDSHISIQKHEANHHEADTRHS